MYPCALFLPDENQRLLHHVALSSGTHLNTNDVFLSRIRDDGIEERVDPLTDLYPFLIVVSPETSDLSIIHCLLRRNPALLEGVEDWYITTTQAKSAQGGLKAKTQLSVFVPTPSKHTCKLLFIESFK